MKRIANFIFIALVALLFVGCFIPNIRLGGVWCYTHSDISALESGPGLTPSDFINLQKDGSYSRDFGVFEIGKWSYSNNRIFLTNEKNDTCSLLIHSLSQVEMQLTGSSGALDNFERLPMSLNDADKNPFSKKNNLWRMPATRKETDEEIKARLLGHCRFWAAYFSWALDNNIETLDVRSTPTPIKIYGNGFALKSIADLPQRWKAYFFDAEDCEKANMRIQYAFEKKTISWAHTDSKYKMFISAFQQLQEELK